MKYSVSPELAIPSRSASATRYELSSTTFSDPDHVVGASAANAIALPSTSVNCPVAAGRSVNTRTRSVGAGWRIDVAAVGLGPRREPEAGGIRVLDVDPRDAWRMCDGDLVRR